MKEEKEEDIEGDLLFTRYYWKELLLALKCYDSFHIYI
jgi:hypothetical protein